MEQEMPLLHLMSIALSKCELLEQENFIYGLDKIFEDLKKLPYQIIVEDSHENIEGIHHEGKKENNETQYEEEHLIFPREDRDSSPSGKLDCSSHLLTEEELDSLFS
jgi:hypothetical protein